MKHSAGVFLYLALAVAAIPAGASTFLFVPQEDLVEQAESVVQGRVIDVQSFWNPRVLPLRCVGLGRKGSGRRVRLSGFS